ncbi:uncharacterized protein MONOS_13663 [Monocercomonoides exilis]|uniref:uncharacterized protein n=1 Tax=Monocercomonoides exilis TaxID=2049356 RepID=UPI00355AC1B7|nr:hypothetical protein MONOS_13663 [Monocercomonoides exilis]|eukprot:MONOS_13663.1-p1 / transcript=MONOS_13663.1 / gene=MONOS_13663 / organism=Monocercomonoides_exilis_PA203 / gene_product=unspecified product / transcript_product=unspecified product / location=Mono_scaffold00860:10424-10819(+) / protein_length=132 / sequence_SO=supercontig / SO=protein_coding / is_pseudo=false
MLERVAGAVIQRKHNKDCIKGGEVNEREKEGGSGESEKSKVGEVEGMDRYAEEAKCAPASTKKCGVEVGMLVGCRKEGGGDGKGSVEEAENRRVGRCEGKVAAGEDAGIEKGNNRRLIGRLIRDMKMGVAI